MSNNWEFNKQLILEDGSIFKGFGFGGKGDCEGEVVFNTSMTGYQESLSDPSYLGQILVFTYPMIGNYGINDNDFESIKPTIKGVIVREVCKKPSNFMSSLSLSEFLIKNQIPAIEGIDTRRLTKKLRVEGVMRGAIVDIKTNPQEIVEKLNQTEETNLIKEAGQENFVKENLELEEGIFRVGLINLGTKDGIVQQLKKRNCSITIFPFNTKSEEILNANLDGVVLSNGPGNPEDAVEAIQLTREIIDKVPILGICMGHQILGLAGGAKVFKLKFGHRSSNHPVKNLLSGKVEITSQNHGYAIDIDSLKNTDLEVSYVGLNDRSCEGLRHKKYPVFSVQFHPESCPGPQDSLHIFDTFIDLIKERRKGKNG